MDTNLVGLHDPSYEVQLLEYVPVTLEWTVSKFNTLSPTEAVVRNAYWGSTKYGARTDLQSIIKLVNSIG